jgi:hypothetical protein
VHLSTTMLPTWTPPSIETTFRAAAAAAARRKSQSGWVILVHVMLALRSDMSLSVFVFRFFTFHLVFYHCQLVLNFALFWPLIFAICVCLTTHHNTLFFHLSFLFTLSAYRMSRISSQISCVLFTNILCFAFFRSFLSGNYAACVLSCQLITACHLIYH